MTQETILVGRDGALAMAVVGRFARVPVRLHPVELVLCTACPVARRADFLAGRRAAATCLAVLGRQGPVLRFPDGRPTFPSGVTGSIGHCDGVGVCAAGLGFQAVGVDLEHVGRVPPAGLHHVCSPAERAWVTAGASARQADRRMTAIFSAKEAVYKAQHALQLPRQGYLGIKLRPRARGFVTAVGSLPPLQVSTQWLGDYVLAVASTAFPRSRDSLSPQGV